MAWTPSISSLFGAGGRTPWRWPLTASSPERAILEALDELPGRESFHTLDMLFEGLDGLRPGRVSELLDQCRSVKAKRLFFLFAERHDHAWLKHVDRDAVDLGSGPRAIVEGGKLHSGLQLVVPAEYAVRETAADGA
ncbi:type IV toxin-antitoxin system AbiEi family antitoxin domain-containing protein [Brevundimonas denitrificans]|uniref:type IV toxin-antitoxin system AbiEi family antitoxin domain-containing protein n=1 Tax=Brevundimonas denitrificans TaxID=1443434 RepID=UPI00223AE8B5|nr:type IV toxin-antitoxin system AbiEi family antitoxin domain-containing protein [Brevundimonas denitrificans]